MIPSMFFKGYKILTYNFKISQFCFLDVVDIYLVLRETFHNVDFQS